MLVDNNTRMIKAIATALGFNPTCLFSATGSRGYIELEELFGEGEMAVQYQNFIPQPCPQKGVAQFVPHLSMVDVVANLGIAGAREYVRDLTPGPEVMHEVTP